MVVTCQILAQENLEIYCRYVGGFQTLFSPSIIMISRLNKQLRAYKLQKKSILIAS